jgi:hypothetical protein
MKKAVWFVLLFILAAPVVHASCAWVPTCYGAPGEADKNCCIASADSDFNSCLSGCDTDHNACLYAIPSLCNGQPDSSTCTSAQQTICNSLYNNVCKPGCFSECSSAYNTCADYCHIF